MGISHHSTHFLVSPYLPFTLAAFPHHPRKFFKISKQTHFGSLSFLPLQHLFIYFSGIGSHNVSHNIFLFYQLYFQMLIAVNHWSASRPSVATEAMDINTDPSWCRDTDPDMALDSSSGPNIIKGPGGSAGHSRSAWHSCR